MSSLEKAFYTWRKQTNKQTNQYTHGYQLTTKDFAKSLVKGIGDTVADYLWVQKHGPLLTKANSVINPAKHPISQ